MIILCQVPVQWVDWWQPSAFSTFMISSNSVDQGTMYWTYYLGHKSWNHTVLAFMIAVHVLSWLLTIDFLQQPTWDCIFAWLSFSAKCSTCRVLWCIVRCSISNFAIILFWLSSSLLSNSANRSFSCSISGSCRPSGLRRRRGIVLHKLSFSIKTAARVICSIINWLAMRCIQPQKQHHGQEYVASFLLVVFDIFLQPKRFLKQILFFATEHVCSSGGTPPWKPEDVT